MTTFDVSNEIGLDAGGGGSGPAGDGGGGGSGQDAVGFGTADALYGSGGFGGGGGGGAYATNGLGGGVGTAGAQGPQGFQGSQGPQGFQGSQGPQGFQGSQGPQGFQGSQGPQGFQGSQGPQGFQGPQGPPCFAAGTRIATPTGQVKVQDLAVGDRVMTLRGVARPIVWIGAGTVLATRGRRTAATPVIVHKGALADNVPNGDLRVTKGHSLYIDEVLIPVEELINHRSIEWDDRAQEVILFHVELETHDVLIANGAPAESYRDDGNRWLFRNANDGWELPPQEPYASVVTGGELVDAAWRRLLDRAGPRPGLALTEEGDLHLMVDGRRLDAVSRRGETYVFRLAARPGAARVVSRAGAPQEFGVARDPRVLGVALRRVVLRQGVRLRLIEAEDVSLAEGFHGYEPDNQFRWTDGNALLPAGLFDGVQGAFELELQVVCRTRYSADAPARAVA
jgi:Hint domain/Collagen triple helix repeat (20 copies)